jgi:hypothetical protein
MVEVFMNADVPVIDPKTTLGSATPVGETTEI